MAQIKALAIGNDRINIIPKEEVEALLLVKIEYFVENASVKTGSYIFKDGSVYKAKVDVATVVEADLTTADKFDTIYTPSKVEVPIKVYQDANQSIKVNELVIHANKLYICKTEVTTTAGWATDEASMEPVDTDTHSVDVIDYDTLNQNDTIEKGKIVIYQNRVYLSKEEFTKSATFQDDEAKLVETALKIDLEQYYKKTETDTLLEAKAPLALPKVEAGQNYKAEQLATYNGLLVRVKEDITNFSEATDATKLDNIGYLPTATATVLGGVKLGDGLEDKANDGVVSTKVNDTTGYLKVEATGLDVDDTKIQKKLTAGEGIKIDGETISSNVKSITETDYTGLADKGTDIYLITEDAQPLP